MINSSNLFFYVLKTDSQFNNLVISILCDRPVESSKVFVIS